MSTSVLLACELNEQKLPPFVLIQESSGADASFLVACLMGSCLKYQQNGVVLVCLHHVSQHYSSAAARLGFNISMAREKGRIIITEPLADIGEQFFASKYLSKPKIEVIDSLFENIKENAEHQLQSKQCVTILIDNVAALIDLGCPQNAVLQFCHKLINLSNDRISIVLKINTSNLYTNFVASLDDYATSNYLVRKMISGDFQEVDGKIIYQKRLDFGHTTKTILYKVGDKNVKIFQPGEVGVRT
ncbi:uncharacterized protein LOC116340863 [Contarinia nasturtii]|uniref:uncharacterized protein LOC116340863 n=1 Tax=Contarinia nasturtii TaxID=265458 RepID=UPI0012D4903A|nr:uncharacterized protein LOC116340863 [Contarinia nasturtii]